MTIYYWCTGQDDNIGDIVLRRRLLNAITTPHRDVIAYVGSASPGFLEAMRFTTQTLCTSRLQWVCKIGLSALRRPTVLIHNPGEIQLDAKTVQAQLALLMPQVLIRLGGGHVIRTGCAVATKRGKLSSIAGLLVALSGRLATLCRWRDTRSGQKFGHYSVTPDWAFAEGAEAFDNSIRDHLVVTMRSDRPQWSADMISEIRNFANAQGLSIRTIVQVRRDRQAMTKLAAQIGGQLVDWPDSRSHADQERVIRSEFFCARMVISDRIHALIIGCTEGALPAAVLSYSDRKVQWHFDAAGLHNIVFDRETFQKGEIQLFLTAVLNRTDELQAAVLTARNRVCELDQIVGASISGLDADGIR